MKIIVNCSTKLRFDFEKYTNCILKILPKQDIVGIDGVHFLDDAIFLGKMTKDALACHQASEKGGRSDIYLCMNNILEGKIRKYLFDSFPEIAALFLSEIISHEVGHHVCTFLRHGIKRQQHHQFVDKYAFAGYYQYLLCRKRKILMSYLLASMNIFRFTSEERRIFLSSRAELIAWLKETDVSLTKFP